MQGSGGSSTSLKVFVGRTLALFLAGAVASFVRTHSLRMAKEGTARRLRKKLLRSLMRQVRALHMGMRRGDAIGGREAAVLAFVPEP